MTTAPAAPKRDLRVAALRRFGIAITVLNTLGHTVLGFETSLAQVATAVGTAYAIEIILELVGAWAERRKPAFVGGGVVRVIDFLLPSHITGLACSMLLYSGDRLLPFAFAAAVGITSKTIFVAPIGGGRFRHFLNPSNTGLVATIFLFPTTAIAAPYHFTENLETWGDVLLPCLIITTGSLLNGKLTKKMPLIFAWVCTFVAQAYFRHLVFDTWFLASLAPLTGVAYILYTFYMISDPGTTPSTTRGQIAFGVTLGLTYGTVVALHIVFPAFIALFTVCTARGLMLWATEGAAVLWPKRSAEPALAAPDAEAPRPAAV